MGRANAQNDPEYFIKSMDSVIAYSQKRKYAKGIAIAYWRKAVSYMRLSDAENAELFIKKNIAFTKQNKLDKYLAETFLFASAFHNQTADYVAAFSDASNALKTSLKMKDSLFIGRSYLQIGRCYSLKPDHAKSEESFKTAIAIFRKINNIPQLRDALSELAKIYVDKKEYPTALKLFSEAEHTAPEIPIDIFRLPHLYGNIARCYNEMGNNKMALDYYLKTLELTEQLGPGMMVIDLTTRTLVGELYIETGQYDLAEKYLKEALELAKVTNTLDDLRILYMDFSALYKLKKDYKKAYEYHELYVTYSDSIMNRDKMEALEDLSVQYQTNEVVSKNKLLQKQNALQKANAEKEQSRKNAWLIALSGALLLLVLGGWFYYRNNKQKQAIAALERNHIKQKLLITQMNPHFIFNSIENIQGLIYANKPDSAVDYLSKFSTLTRQILEHSNENYISLFDEVQMIKNYMAIQQLLYDNKFDYTIAVEEAIEQESLFLPPMLTQPFIENAIKHGLNNKAQGGMVNIRFYLEQNKLLFEVLDNGKGFDGQQKQTNHKSLAMTITKERLVNYTKNKDFVVQTDNVMDGTSVVGAKVRFEIPYIYEN
ncbi:tetratricopeptide repeat-containing sensor histidine kinase [Flavobacterium caeni]|uniref:tetratricopeptide repeat-containing sensor histidine kinase n=1 Tax=Flavobacterium caeni TaxID=490189 RepID=UPI00147A8FBD|nr:histidine kinase [Flavobacterium caeni]